MARKKTYSSKTKKYTEAETSVLSLKLSEKCKPGFRMKKGKCVKIKKTKTMPSSRGYPR